MRSSASITFYNITHVAKAHGTLQKRVCVVVVVGEDCKNQRIKMSDVRVCLLSITGKVHPLRSRNMTS